MNIECNDFDYRDRDNSANYNFGGFFRTFGPELTWLLYFVPYLIEI